MISALIKVTQLITDTNRKLGPTRLLAGKLDELFWSNKCLDRVAHCQLASDSLGMSNSYLALLSVSMKSYINYVIQLDHFGPPPQPPGQNKLL